MELGWTYFPEKSLQMVEENFTVVTDETVTDFYFRLDQWTAR